MIWAEFKRSIEAHGITDDTKFSAIICWFDDLDGMYVELRRDRDGKAFFQFDDFPGWRNRRSP